jgi:hypothetical protein
VKKKQSPKKQETDKRSLMDLSLDGYRVTGRMFSKGFKQLKKALK